MIRPSLQYPLLRSRVSLAVAASILLLLLVALVFGPFSRTPASAAQHTSQSRSASAHPAPPRSPSSIGAWGAPINLGIVTIHAVLLHTGKVLYWDYPNASGTGGTLAILYDPVTGIVTNLPHTSNIDFFCAGQSQLSDGRIIIDGGLTGPLGTGANGITSAIIFDPVKQIWTNIRPMHYARYYPTNVQLADGTNMVFSGNDAHGKISVQVEDYSPSTGLWTTLPSTADLPGTQQNYPRMFLLPTGNIFEAGVTQNTRLLNVATNRWSDIGNTNYPYRHGEGAVLMPSLSHVMVFGGQVLEQLPTNTTESIDLSQPTPVWTYGTPMNFARHDLNALQLPDGTVLIVGGASGAGKYQNPIKQAELYNPATSQFTIMAAQQGSRGYHSTALLLPDATVISSGSDSNDPLQNYAEIYTPSYLFNGPRPTITSAPTQFTYGMSYAIQTPAAAKITSAVLIRTDAATHADHFDQRFLQLSFTIGNGQITVTAPANGNIAPPGYYMLFILNNLGVPSIAPIIHLL